MVSMVMVILDLPAVERTAKSCEETMHQHLICERHPLCVTDTNLMLILFLFLLCGALQTDRGDGHFVFAAGT
jgi:hypothetical protein